MCLSQRAQAGEEDHQHRAVQLVVDGLRLEQLLERHALRHRERHERDLVHRKRHLYAVALRVARPEDNAGLRWQDRPANQKFFAGEIQAFSKEAADLLLELGIVKTVPDTAAIIDTRFIK